MTAANAMVTAAATAVAAAMLTATAKAALKWLLSSSEAAVGLSATTVEWLCGNEGRWWWWQWCPCFGDDPFWPSSSSTVVAGNGDGSNGGLC